VEALGMEKKGKYIPKEDLGDFIPQYTSNKNA
jgi:hypothetical protein